MTRSLATLCGRTRAANVRLVLKIIRLQAIGVSRMRQKGEFPLRSTGIMERYFCFMSEREESRFGIAARSRTGRRTIDSIDQRPNNANRSPLGDYFGDCQGDALNFDS